jgi:thiol-disulfide isomerase/thioredoxin
MKPAGAGIKAAVAALGGLGVLIGIWAGSGFHSMRLPAPGQVKVPAGEASPPIAGDFAADPVAGPREPAKVPEQLPVFTLGDRNGRATPVATWAGKSLVLNFWATWCAPCRREIPLLTSVSNEWGDRGVEVVGVAVDHREKVAAYADALKIPYPILVGEQDALDLAAKFGVESPVFPFTVFTDHRGQVVTLYIGELHKAQVDLILSIVQDLNAGQVSLAEAQRQIASGLHAPT